MLEYFLRINNVSLEMGFKDKKSTLNQIVYFAILWKLVFEERRGKKNPKKETEDRLPIATK